MTLGQDTWCADELRTGRYATGATNVALAAYRRLITPKGTLRGGDDEADYGLDLSELVGSLADPSDSAALPGRIRAELSKDERILTLDVVVLTVTDGPTVSYEVTIQAETADGPFELTLDVDDVTTEIVGLVAA